ncbi:hypothetical protein [Micromonospora robiginosa]|uniref:Uncharacterized protein n=1 Tax=Micromonospora robiginosa TaxID=2749844 RepID=A0A7L6AZ31_9ACTN|nr:hypothetical protein [Micromonospora ferruginea]QLQ34913.1 hypothetical protein H1D33_15855 [Micromonospora ferruginea]
MAPGPPTLLTAADEAARPLRAVLEDVWLTLDTAVEGEGRWLELYRGTPADPVFVCLDAMSNVLHVRFDGPDSLTVSYLPGWCYEAATAAHADRRPEASAVLVTDVDTAQPLVFDIRVEHRITGAERSVVVGGEAIPYAPLPMGYTFTPARAFEIEEADAPATPLVHWSAMRLLLAMAPGVSYSARPLLDADGLRALRAAYLPGDGPTRCDQSLAFEVRRHRRPDTLPPLGGPLEPVPLAEPDLVAGTVALDAAVGGALLPTSVQQVRADGLDLVLIRPDPRRPPVGQPWSWQPDWFVAAASALDDVAFSLAKDLYDTYIDWLGGIPDSAPLPIHVRVDPTSAEDRFAYRLDLLDDDGEPAAGPADPVLDGPVWQLTVIRTPGVRVFLDDSVGAVGVSTLRGVVRYREQVVTHFDDVPLEITDEVVPVRDLPARPATLDEIAHVVVTVGEFVPVPTVQAMYDLRDLGSVAAWVLTGEDLQGKPMSGLAAALTLGGVLVPPVAERVGGSLLAAGRRVLTRGDVPLPRLARAAAEATPVDADLAATLLAELPQVSP